MRGFGWRAAAAAAAAAAAITRPRLSHPHAHMPISLSSPSHLDGRQHAGDVVDGGPLVLEDVQADAAVRVDVGVEHGARELHGGRAVGVLLREVQGQLEGA